MTRTGYPFHSPDPKGLWVLLLFAGYAWGGVTGRVLHFTNSAPWNVYAVECDGGSGAEFIRVGNGYVKCDCEALGIQPRVVRFAHETAIGIRTFTSSVGESVLPNPERQLNTRESLIVITSAQNTI